MSIIASLIGAGATIAGTLLSKKSTTKTNQQNYDLTQETWKREDNAVQRRVNDLEKAGLSKTLAAGSAADSSSAISMKSSDYSGIGSAGQQIGQGIIQAIQLKDQLATSAAQRALAQAQAEKAVSDSKLNEANAEFVMKSKTAYTETATEVMALNRAKLDAEKARDYPALREIESQIAIKKKELKVMDLDIDKKKLDFDNLKYDTGLQRYLGNTSTGPKSRIGSEVNSLMTKLFARRYQLEKYGEYL